MPEIFIATQRDYLAAAQDVDGLIQTCPDGPRVFFDEYRRSVHRGSQVPLIGKLSEILVEGDLDREFTFEDERREQGFVSGLGIAAGALYVARLNRLAPQGAEVVTPHEVFEAYGSAMNTYDAVGVPANPDSPHDPARDTVLASDRDIVFASSFRASALEGSKTVGEGALHVITRWSELVTPQQNARQFFRVGMGMMIDAARDFSEGRARAQATGRAREDAIFAADLAELQRAVDEGMDWGGEFQEPRG